MNKRKKIILSVLGGIIISTSLFLYFTRDHWWIKKSCVVVYVNGSISADSLVYQSTNGRLLAEIHHGGLIGFFLIDTVNKEITIPHGSNFIRMPFCRFSKNEDPVTVLYGKTGRDPRLIIKNEFIHFMFLNNNVLLSFNNN